uniref:ATP-dependent RNA helicase n=1 Tax=Panagrolaimus sp. PS1159 TaxID=55785 RepID=A0AC35FAL2_9BILA
MGESEGYSSPEYSDDEIKKKPKEKKVVKEVIKEEEIKLPSQVGYKPKESKIPPPPDRSADPLDKKKIFLPKPRHIKRNERYSGNRTRNEKDVEESRNERYSRNENIDAGETKNGKPSAIGATGERAKNKPMIPTNIRPAREGSEIINDEVKIYYRASKSANPIEPYVNPGGNETYESFVKSSSNPECRQFLDSKLVKNLKINEFSKLRPVQIAMLTAALTYPREHPETLNADILCTSKTGSGKTLAFIVPILQKAIERRDLQPNKDARTPMSLIFVNSTELAMSVFHVVKALLHGLHLRVVVMAASLNFVENTNFDIGICTNGRFQNHFSHTMTLGNSAVQLDLSQLEYIVIDEVDKMAQDLKFLDILDKLKIEAKKPRIYGLSATIDADTTQIIRYSSVFLIKCGEH